jgi:hypothetical protein
MDLAETSRTHHERAESGSVTGDPSVSSSLEHLVAGSQGVITKRIDLALLEGQELLSRSVERGALAGAGLLLAAAAWFAAAGAFVLFVLPDARPVIHFAAFGLLTAGGAVGLIALAMRRGRPQIPRIRPSSGASGTAE